ncbi:hypothetical protein [Streptomyces sp. 8N706]|uniref:hypothetical protein n=1 Tax=Streptomyces sp. 8N706 TaxID=3457416 RepID=UPI003FCFB9EF
MPYPRGRGRGGRRRRIRLAEQLGDDVLDREPWRVGPRLVILLEEVNATMTQLKRYWAKKRESGDPRESPAVDALAEILFMGRQVRLHVLLVAQSATARAIGGPTATSAVTLLLAGRHGIGPPSGGSPCAAEARTWSVGGSITRWRARPR